MTLGPATYSAATQRILMQTSSFADTVFLLHRGRMPTRGERRVIEEYTRERPTRVKVPVVYDGLPRRDVPEPESAS